MAIANQAKRVNKNDIVYNQNSRRGSSQSHPINGRAQCQEKIGQMPPSQNLVVTLMTFNFINLKTSFFVL